MLVDRNEYAFLELCSRSCEKVEDPLSFYFSYVKLKNNVHPFFPETS